MKRRFLLYGALGWCLEILWTGLPKRRPVDWRLAGHTSWWMFPIYGLIAPLYEPLHAHLRATGRPWPARGLVYMLGIMGVEVATGWLIERATGKIPWDYRGSTRWQWRGLTRLDYAPLWFLVGLGLEPIHDRLATEPAAALHPVGRDYGGTTTPTTSSRGGRAHRQAPRR